MAEARRPTIKQPLGPQLRAEAERFDDMALRLEDKALTETDPLKIYALRLTACGYRRKSLLIRGTRGADLDPILAKLWSVAESG